MNIALGSNRVNNNEDYETSVDLNLIEAENATSPAFMRSVVLSPVSSRRIASRVRTLGFKPIRTDKYVRYVNVVRMKGPVLITDLRSLALVTFYFAKGGADFVQKRETNPTFQFKRKMRGRTLNSPAEINQ